MHSSDLHDLPAGHVCVDQKPEGVVTRLQAEEAKHPGRSARQGGQKHPDNSSSSSARSTHQAKVTSLTNTPDDSHDTSFNTAQPGLHRLPQSSQTLTGSAMSQWKAPSEPEAMGISTYTSRTGAAGASGASAAAVLFLPSTSRPGSFPCQAHSTAQSLTGGSQGVVQWGDCHNLHHSRTHQLQASTMHPLHAARA
jgi:hypothetical protein